MFPTLKNTHIGYIGSKEQQAYSLRDEDVTSNSETLSYDELLDAMVQWAKSGFKPCGPDGFKPSEGGHGGRQTKRHTRDKYHDSLMKNTKTAKFH